MEGRRVGLVYDERMCAHADPRDPSHPEAPDRIVAIAKRLKAAGVFDRCICVQAREASEEELTSVHTKKHVNLMRQISSKAFGRGREKLANYYNSIYFNEGSSESALLAAGSVVELCVAVARGDLEAGAAIVRPPGHHAEADSPMGFCLFNNVAVAAHVLVHEKQDLGIQKVLIVDWDVHHGNGTQNMFWDDDKVLYFSVHRYDGGSFYPMGTEGNYDKIGSGRAAGFNVNVPWPHAGFGDSDYLAVWNHVLLPIAKKFNPDIVLISGGFDSAEGDPLGGCCLTPFGFSEMTRKLTELAKGRVILVLEGGYNLKSIAESYLACLQVLLGDSPYENSTIPNTESLISTWNLLTKVRGVLQEFWPVLHELSSSFQKEMNELMSTSSIGETLAYTNLSDADSDNSGDSNSELSEDKTQVLEPEVGTSGANIKEAEIFDHMIEQVATLTMNMQNKPERLEDGTGTEESVALCCDDSATESFKSGENTRSCLRCEDGLVSDSFVENDALETNDRGGDEQQMYIWYAAYGSNMWRDRFMCYIKGGQVGNQMFFGHSYTRTWGHGGAAFLEARPTAGVSTHIRLYKIMLDQFNDLFLQENSLDYGRDLVKPAVIRSLGQESASSITLVEGCWYGTILHLGDKDGLPILTFTCSEQDLERFDSGLLPVCPPSEEYQWAVARGLMEDLGLSKERALSYVLSKQRTP
eukprot:c15499_g1_i2 orf=284-2374(-)